MKATQGTVVLSNEAEDTGVVDEVINHRWGWGGRIGWGGSQQRGEGLRMGEFGRFRQAQGGASRSLWSLSVCHTGTVSLQAAQAVNISTLDNLPYDPMVQAGLEFRVITILVPPSDGMSKIAR